jgi:hypothetical protein
LQAEAELARQERTWRSKPAYGSEAEMAEDFHDAGVRVILDFGYTKHLPIEEARTIHDYSFASQQAYPDVIIGNWVHSSPSSLPPRSSNSAAVSSGAWGLPGSPSPAPGSSWPAARSIVGTAVWVSRRRTV